MHPIAKNVILNLVKQHSSQKSKIGRPSACNEIILDSISLVLKSGMAWRHLAETKSKYDFRTVHRKFIQWTSWGVFKNAYKSLLKLYLVKNSSKIKYCCIDSSYVKNVIGRNCIGRNPSDRGRKATKLSAIVTDKGIPISLVFFPGNTADVNTVSSSIDYARELLSGFDHKRLPLYADKGYDSRAVRNTVNKAGFLERVAKRRVHTHRVLNYKRTVVENFFGWLDKARRLILRYDADIESHSSFTHLAVCSIIARKL